MAFTGQFTLHAIAFSSLSPGEACRSYQGSSGEPPQVARNDATLLLQFETMDARQPASSVAKSPIFKASGLDVPLARELNIMGKP